MFNYLRKILTLSPSQKYLSLKLIFNNSFYMSFKELSNKEWPLIEPLLPPKNRIGRPRLMIEKLLIEYRSLLKDLEE